MRGCEALCQNSSALGMPFPPGKRPALSTRFPLLALWRSGHHGGEVHYSGRTLALSTFPSGASQIRYSSELISAAVARRTESAASASVKRFEQE